MKTFTVVLLSLVSLGANATPPATSSAYSSSTASSSSTSNQTLTATPVANGGLGGSVSVEDRLQLPFAPAMGASSSTTTAPNRVLKQRTVSFLLGGWTNVDMELDVVSFVHVKRTKREELAACVESQKFRELRALEGNPCPNSSSLLKNPLNQN